MRPLAAMWTAMALWVATPALAAEPIQVIVLGTYHFENPGLDLNNVRADDVLKPKRQAELEALATALAKFRPTKILVERQTKGPDFTVSSFAEFTPEKLGTDRDEAVQIGYRLASKLGLKRIHGIDERPGKDEPNYFPIDKVMSFAEANKMGKELQALMAKGAKVTQEFEAKQANMSIARLLMGYNDPKGEQSSIQTYYELLQFGDGEQQPGADLNAMWYLRNAKIFAKLMKVAVPGDRLLVIYGAGHNYWLRHFASETPGFRHVDPLPYLEAADRK